MQIHILNAVLIYSKIMLSHTLKIVLEVKFFVLIILIFHSGKLNNFLPNEWEILRPAIKPRILTFTWFDILLLSHWIITKLLWPTYSFNLGKFIHAIIIKKKSCYNIKLSNWKNILLELLLWLFRALFSV